MIRSALFAGVLALAAGPATAGEVWHVVKDGANVWAYNKGGAIYSKALGLWIVRLARYHQTPETDGTVSYAFDVRGYSVDCVQGRVRHQTSERFSANGAPVAPAVLPDVKPWVPMSFGWTLALKKFACDGEGLEKAVKAPSKVAALALMTTVAEPAATTAVATPAEAVAPAPNDEPFCRDLREVVGLGGQDRPAFSSFYLNETERNKYAGLGSKQIGAFGGCKIQRSMWRPMQPGKYFGSYYCKKSGLGEAAAKALAADTAKRVEACLRWSYGAKTDENGSVVMTYEHSQEVMSPPRVRVTHEKDNSVTLYLDSNGR